MRNRLATLLRSAVEWLQKGSRKQSDKPLSHEELRDIVLEILSEQATRREQAAQSARAFGVEGAVSSGTPGQIAKFQINGTDVENSIAKEVDGKIGIGVGMQTPGARLESFVTSAPDIPLRLNTNFAGGNPVDFYPYVPAVNNAGFQLSLGGTPRLVIRGDAPVAGNVGIGTTAPANALHVVKSVNNDYVVRIDNSGGDGQGLLIRASDGGPGDTQALLSVEDFAGTQSIFRVEGRGNVGIGTTDRLSRLTVRGRTSFTAAGTVSTTAGSAAVTGTGTSFTKQVGVGDRITVPDLPVETRTVTAIADDTHLTVDIAFTATKSGKVMTVLPSLFRIDDASGNERLHVTDQGNVHIGGSPEIRSEWKSLLFGADSPRQINVFGPEMITAVGPPPGGTDNRRVVLWAGKTDGNGKPDTEAMFLINANGWLEWGAGGTSDQDILLERSGSNQLTLNDTFIVANSDDPQPRQPRIALKHNSANGGEIRFGSGTAADDVNLYRNGADQLRTDDAFLVPSGSAGTPTLAFGPDPNTGLYNPLADEIAFVTGGSERMRIRSDGKVGIGNASPKFVLHTSGAAVALGAPNSSPSDPDLNNSNISFWLDETVGAEKLMVRVRLSGGAYKTATIALT